MSAKKINAELLLLGRPEHEDLFLVEGFTLRDATTLLLNYLSQASDDDLAKLLVECQTRTTTNCWCMSYDLAPSLAKFVEQEIRDRK